LARARTVPGLPPSNPPFRPIAESSFSDRDAARAAPPFLPMAEILRFDRCPSPHFFLAILRLFPFPIHLGKIEITALSHQSCKGCGIGLRGVPPFNDLNIVVFIDFGDESRSVQMNDKHSVARIAYDPFWQHDSPAFLI
jgi:hypothetical protein